MADIVFVFVVVFNFSSEISLVMNVMVFRVPVDIGHQRQRRVQVPKLGQEAAQDRFNGSFGTNVRLSSSLFSRGGPQTPSH